MERLQAIKLANISTNTYNCWHRLKQDAITPVSSAEWAQSDYVIVLAKWLPYLDLPAMRAANPGVKIFVYYPLNFAAMNDTEHYPLSLAYLNEHDLWLYTGDDTPVVVTGAGSEQYIQPIVATEYVAAVIAKIEQYALDGVVLDQWIPRLYAPEGYTPATWWFPTSGYWLTHEPVTAYPDNETWGVAWHAFYQEICDAVHNAGYIAIGNEAGNYNTADTELLLQREYLDGTVYEKFFVSNSNGDWLLPAEVNTRIEAFAADPLIAMTADIGLTSTLPDFAAKVAGALAMYLLAIPPAGQAGRSFHYYKDAYWFHDDAWDVDYGEPVDSTQMIDFGDGSYSWIRDFTNCSVELSYDPTAEPKYMAIILITTQMVSTMSASFRRVFTMAYADQATLNDFLPATLAVSDTIEANRLLERATELIDYHTLGNIDITDIDHIAAAEKATCAQVEYWLGPAGEDVDLQGGIRSISRSKASTTFVSSNPELAPRAKRILTLAGLLSKAGGGLK